MAVKATRCDYRTTYFQIDASKFNGLLHFTHEFDLSYDSAKNKWVAQELNCEGIRNLDIFEISELIEQYGLLYVLDWFREHPEEETYNGDPFTDMLVV